MEVFFSTLPCSVLPSSSYELTTARIQADRYYSSPSDALIYNNFNISLACQLKKVCT